MERDNEWQPDRWSFDAEWSDGMQELVPITAPNARQAWGQLLAQLDLARGIENLKSIKFVAHD